MSAANGAAHTRERDAKIEFSGRGFLSAVGALWFLPSILGSVALHDLVNDPAVPVAAPDRPPSDSEPIGT